MGTSAPLNADISIKFSNIQYEGGTAVDLTTADDIIVAIALGTPLNTPLVLLKNSESPTKFNIDNTTKSVTVELDSDELGSTIGKFYANLWIVVSGSYQTHLVKSFTIESAVNYTN